MGLHGLGVCEGHGERRADTAGWADGAEQVDAIVALVGRLARASATPGPLPDDLSSVRSGLRPGTRSRYVFPWGCGRDAPSGSPGSFFECLDNPGLLARMARSRADVGEADLLQELADR